MAKINGKCVELCDFCYNGGECLEGFDVNAEKLKCERLNPEYYAGVDPMKTGDELITEERNRQFNDLGFSIAYDLSMWHGAELENSILALLTGNNYQPNIWGDDHKRCAQVRTLPIQVRRVMAGALICAQIDVDNLKHQVLINEQKRANDALRGNKKG